MPVLGNVLLALGVVVQNVFLAYSLVLLARAVVSWVDADPRNPIVRFLHAATEPLLRVVRRMLPTNLRYFPIDIAFLVVVAIVLFAQYTVAQGLIDIGSRLRRPVLVEPV
jgi:YggT family protein